MFEKGITRPAMADSKMKNSLKQDRFATCFKDLWHKFLGVPQVKTSLIKNAF